MRLQYDAASRTYFALDIDDSYMALLVEMRWSAHTAQARCWWTKSPYLASPFWGWIDPRDEATRAALGWYAWNYSTSFAKGPLQGTGVDEIRLPAGSKPYPFQIAGVQRIIMRKRLLLGDDRGTGKTFQSLAAINLLRPQRIVIGCPAFLVDNWAKECEKWLCDPRSITILGRGKKQAPHAGIVILPFSLGHKFAEPLLNGPPIDYLIADQCEQLKSPGARRTVPWLGEAGLFAKAERVVATTGSPIPNNPLEIHGLLSALSPEMRISREAFQVAYCSTFRGVTTVATKRGGEASVEFEKNSGKNEAALNAELRASGTMVRRLKADVLEQLPPKRVFCVYLTPTGAIEDLVQEELTLYQMLETKLMTPQEMIALQGHVANVRARLGLLKAPKIAEYVRFVIGQGETRVVVFMLHLAAIEAVRKSFEGTRIKVRVLTGAQSPRERDQHVTEFQRPGGCEVAVCQIKAAGLGLTMTAARVVVLGEISWTPTDNDEAADRCWRIGQERPVEVPVLTWPHAVEERVLHTNAVKAISSQKILDINLQNIALQ